VIQLDAFPAKDCAVVRAVKVHDTLVVGLAKLVFEALIFFVKVYLTEQRIPFYHFIKNINVKRKSLGGL